MICQNCQKNQATVHVTEIFEGVVPAAEPDKGKYHEQHLCEICAQTMDLPHTPAVKKTMADIWKLLQISAQQTRKKSTLACPDCGMSLEEFRKKGRLGCPKDYEVFKSHIVELLERVHGARTHSGRLPGTTEEEIQQGRRLSDLRRELETAIRAEAYEQAANLRDAIKAIEVTGEATEKRPGEA